MCTFACSSKKMSRLVSRVQPTSQTCLSRSVGEEAQALLANRNSQQSDNLLNCSELSQEQEVGIPANADTCSWESCPSSISQITVWEKFTRVHISEFLCRTECMTVLYLFTCSQGPALCVSCLDTEIKGREINWKVLES